MLVQQIEPLGPSLRQHGDARSRRPNSLVSSMSIAPKSPNTRLIGRSLRRTSVRRMEYFGMA
jgi:hypothetical protein